MRFIATVAAILISMSVFSECNFQWGNTNREVGIVIEKCRLTRDGVQVKFSTDQPPPYVVGLYPTDTAQFSTPRFPFRKETFICSPAFIRGNFVGIPMYVCVMSEPTIPTNLFQLVTSDTESGLSTTNDFGLACLTEEQMKFFSKEGVKLVAHDQEDWGFWRGVHADFDGTLFVKQGTAKVRIPCSAPSHSLWRSETVIMPTPFKSMSSYNGYRLNMSDNGILYWQKDTNSVSRRIYFGGL